MPHGDVLDEEDLQGGDGGGVLLEWKAWHGLALGWAEDRITIN